MMPILIVNAGLAGRALNDPDEWDEPEPQKAREYLRVYDPEYAKGRGRVDWTTDIDDARRYPDIGAAYKEWVRQSRLRPLRDDGLPNRPLTAYSITFETVEK